MVICLNVYLSEKFVSQPCCNIEKRIDFEIKKRFDNCALGFYVVIKIDNDNGTTVQSKIINYSYKNLNDSNYDYLETKWM